MRKVAACVTLLALACSVRAGSVEVQVGYADDIRPTPFFPSPWFGDAGVALFAGSPGAAQSPGSSDFDAGAIRVINNTGAAITINDLTVDSFGDGSSFHIWGGSLPFSLPAGMSAIFTQTSQYNFDVSDDEGSDPAAIPRVQLTVNGVETDLFDTAQVLNTEGTDHLGANNLNESHQWRDIGTFGGQAGTPEPASFVLLGMGIAGMASYGWRKRKAAAA